MLGDNRMTRTVRFTICSCIAIWQVVTKSSSEGLIRLLIVVVGLTTQVAADKPVIRTPLLKGW